MKIGSFCLSVLILVSTIMPSVSFAADGYTIGVYRFKMVHNGWMCFDFTSGDLSDSVALRLRPCTGGVNQEWQVERVKTGYAWLRFRNVLNNTCLAVDPDGNPNFPVVQRACTEGVNDYSQQWKDNSGGFGIEYDDSPLQFKSRVTGKCLQNKPTVPPIPYGVAVKEADCNKVRQDKWQKILYNRLSYPPL